MVRRSVKAPGKNGEASLDDLLSNVMDALNNWPVGSPFHNGSIRASFCELLAALGRDERAEVILPEVTYEANQLRATFHVAAEQAKSGKHRAAEKTIERGLEWKEKYELEGEPATIALSALAVAYHASGRRREAQETFALAREQADAEKYSPSQPYPHLAQAHVRCGDFLGACEVFEAPNAFYSFALQPMFSKIAIGLYRAGHKDKLRQLVEQVIKEDHEIHLIMEPLVRCCLEERDDETAFEIVELIPAPYQDRCLKPMIEIWLERAELDKVKKAAELWRKSGASPAKLAQIYLLLKDGDNTANILETLIPEALAPPNRSVPEQNAWFYYDLAETLGVLGRTETALQCIKKLDSEEPQTLGMLALIEGLYKQDRFDALIDMFAHVQQWVRSIRDDSVRAPMLAQISKSMLTHGRKKEGEALFKEALALAADIKRPSSDQGQSRRRAIESILRCQLQAGDLVGAFRASKKLRIGGQRDRLLHELLQAWVRTGDLAAVLVILNGIKTIEDRAYAGVKALESYLETFGFDNPSKEEAPSTTSPS